MLFVFLKSSYLFALHNAKGENFQFISFFLSARFANPPNIQLFFTAACSKIHIFFLISSVY